MRKQSIVSVIVLSISILNIILGAFGITPLAIDENMVYTLVTLLGTIFGAVGATWYNCSLTTPAQKADIAIDGVKNGDICLNELMKNIIHLSNTLRGDEVK